MSLGLVDGRSSVGRRGFILLRVVLLMPTCEDVFDERQSVGRAICGLRSTC